MLAPGFILEDHLEQERFGIKKTIFERYRFVIKEKDALQPEGQSEWEIFGGEIASTTSLTYGKRGRGRSFKQP